LALVVLALLALAGSVMAVAVPPGGEYATPRRVPYQDPPPTVAWGPFAVPDLRGLQWGFYGMSYHGMTDRLCGVYFWSDSVTRYRSVDSTNPSNPDTIKAFRTPGPASDSFQDMDYCWYDNCFWVHSSKQQKVFKINALTGQTVRSFPTPAVGYAVGIAFDERAKKLYLVDRMTEGVYPCSLYVTDTMGTVEQRFGLNLGYSYAGARCLDMDYTSSNPNWPSLLLTYTFFSGTGTLDSTVLFELDKTNMAVLNRCRLPDLAGYINNIRGVAWDPRDGGYWIGIMQNPDNNIYKLQGWHTPYTTDVGVMTIQAPRTGADSGEAIIPRALVRNFGATTQTFPVEFKIGTLYDEVRSKTVAPGREDTVTFPVWAGLERGYLPEQCITELPGDMFTRNDTVHESLMVVRRDIACTQLLAPAGTVDSGQVVTPRAIVRNNGDGPEDFSVAFTIAGGYYDTAVVLVLPPAQVETVSFQGWTAPARGPYATKCSTRLSHDLYHWNDKQEGSVTVAVTDVGVTSITAPVDTVDSGQVTTPQVMVTNTGTGPAGFWTGISIGTRYSAAESTYLAPGASQPLAFADWTPEERGLLAIRCSTMLSGDQIPLNNLIIGWVYVRVRDAAAVQIIAPVGQMDTGTVVTPKAIVANHGTGTASFPVRFKIGADYTHDTSVTLSAGGSDTATFPDWIAAPLGWLMVRCTTLLPGDQNTGNNLALDSVRVLPLMSIKGAGPAPALPVEFALKANVPNPFTAATRIDFALPRAVGVELHVYSAGGKLMRALASGSYAAGYYHVTWDGRDGLGRNAPAGLYFYRLRAQDVRLTRKMLKLN
jgi:hypothetical protein